MASEWFYARDGQKHGPYSSPQLRAMAQSGELLRTDLIWKEGMADWRPAGETTQLFAGVRESGKTQSKAKAAVADSGGAEATVPQPKGLKATAQAAARATQLAAERTKLTTVSLPAAYLELGKHCYDTRAFASDFPKEMSELDQLEARLSAEAESTAPTSASSWSDRAKAMAGKGLEFAQKQKAAFEKAAALKRLGKLAYEKHGNAAGPPEVCEAVHRMTVRIAEIDQHNSTPAGAPRKKRPLSRYLVACAALFAVMCLVGAVKQAIAPTKPDSADSGSASSAGQMPVTEFSETASKPNPQVHKRPDKPRSPPQSAPGSTTPPVSAARPARRLDPAREKLLRDLLMYRVEEMDSDSADMGVVLRAVVHGEATGLDWLTQFPSIESLTLPSDLRDVNKALVYVCGLRRLRTLDARKCGLTLDNLRTLAGKCPQLDALAFSYKCSKEDEHPFDTVVNALADFAALRCVSIELKSPHNPDAVSASPGIMSKCNGLSYIEITNDPWHRKRLQPILEAIGGHPTLQTLRLQGFGYVVGGKSDYTLDCLAECKKLTELAIVADTTGMREDKVLRSVARLPQLTHLWCTKRGERIIAKTHPGLYKGDADDEKAPTWSGRVLPLSKKTRKLDCNAHGVRGVHFKPDE